MVLKVLQKSSAYVEGFNFIDGELFTGILDSDGKEIFTGDLISISFNEEKFWYLTVKLVRGGFSPFIDRFDEHEFWFEVLQDTKNWKVKKINK